MREEETLFCQIQCHKLDLSTVLNQTEFQSGDHDHVTVESGSFCVSLAGNVGPRNYVPVVRQRDSVQLEAR